MGERDVKTTLPLPKRCFSETRILTDESDLFAFIVSIVHLALIRLKNHFKEKLIRIKTISIEDSSDSDTHRMDAMTDVMNLPDSDKRKFKTF